MTARSSVPTGRARLSRFDAPIGALQGVRLVRRTLARWGLDGEYGQATDALLVAGELLANAWQHGGGARSVEVFRHGSRIRIAVSDASDAVPSVDLPYAATRPRGHGLYLVERVAGRWGVTPRRGGKTVWAEVILPSPDGQGTRRGRALIGLLAS